MQVKTGKGTIAVSTLIAIWSISLVVNLPGLAITPMMGTLNKIFPHATELEVQLLSVLPNLMIIPFVLLAGKLSLSKSKIALVFWALVGFTACGVAYFFAKSMPALIVISCLLGCSCGLLIPIAAGLLSDTFVGKYRMKQLGIKSGISNIALVAATYIVGWLSYGNWHMPFAVYLIPIIPLALTPFLRKIPKSDLYPTEPDEQQKQTLKAAAAPEGETLRGGFYIKRIWALIGVYFFTCYWVDIISYYMPFLMKTNHMATSNVGMVTAIFFLMIFLPGASLPFWVKTFRKSLLIVCTAIMIVGTAMVAFIPTLWSYIIGAALMGFGYGVFQPMIYDKATYTVISERKATLALAFVLAANYLALAACPLIADGIADIFGLGHSATFPFLLNFILGCAFMVIVLCKRNSFAFSVDPQYM